MAFCGEPSHEGERMKSAMALILVLASSSLAGCGLFHPHKDCDKPQAYESSRSIDKLRAPAGLDAPDTKDALVIPQVNAPEAPRHAAGGCLDEPPQYRNEAAPAAPVAPEPVK